MAIANQQCRRSSNNKVYESPERSLTEHVWRGDFKIRGKVWPPIPCQFFVPNPCSGLSFSFSFSFSFFSLTIKQEMCNPKVRPHLSFYPEDKGKYVSEIRQASNWLNEVSPDEVTPMIRVHNDDYYIYEPAMINSGRCCIPFRWFIKNGNQWGRAWTLERRLNVHTGKAGWVVRKDLVIEFSDVSLLKNFPQLSKDHGSYGVPHPSHILGKPRQRVLSFLALTLLLGIHSDDPDHPQFFEWTHTNPIVGNRWRQLSKGHRTLFLPMMTYCDDTSGNQSKKWNEHNSFLFTLAGLPREEASKEYNIHFLCTSNLAPPLEMMDGVVQQIE